jgi:uncharacterized membrane protein YgcG
LKSAFEYFSFAHFIDIVLAVQITFLYGIFNVVAYAFEDEELRGFYEEEEEDKWLIQNEFVDNFSFKISSAGTRRICGFNLFTRFCVTSEYSGSSLVYIGIRNNTSGRSLRCRAFIFPMIYKRRVREFQSLLHRKLGVGDRTFDNGDDVSISVLRHHPAFQIRRIGVQWLYEEEGDDDDIQSKHENAHNSSGGGGGGDGGGGGGGDGGGDGDGGDDDAHVAKVEIASHIFRNYYCAFRCFLYDGNFTCWYFAKKGLEILLF